MTEPTFVYLSEVEMRAIERRAQVMRGAYVGKSFRAGWVWLRSLFAKSGVRTADAH